MSDTVNCLFEVYLINVMFWWLSVFYLLSRFTDFVCCSALLVINGGSTDCNINLCTSPLYFGLI